MWEMGNNQLPVRAEKTRDELLEMMKPVYERHGPEEAEKNAALVNFELEVVSTKVDRFGWHNLSPRVKDRLTQDWHDVLSDYPVREVRRAILDCLGENSKKCPNELDVKHKIEQRRQKALSLAPKEYKQPKKQNEDTPEQKKEIDELVKKAFNRNR